MVEPGALVSEALSARVEGITLLGGEPFDQAVACATLARTAQRAGLGVICFTGFTREMLESDEDASQLIAEVDLLVDGPYAAELPESERALVGSTNQRFLNLSPRYADYDPVRAHNRVDVRIAADGTIDVAGFLSQDRLHALGISLGARRAFSRDVDHRQH